MRQKHGSFLMEYAVYLAVIGIIFTMISLGYTKYIAIAKQQSAFEHLNQVSNVINDFVATHCRLPNPSQYVKDDSATYGMEHLNASGDIICPNPIASNICHGTIPHIALGIEKSNIYKDKKGNEISYIINFDFTDSTKFEQNSLASDIVIKDEKDKALLDKNTMGGVAYVLVWHGGKKKFGAWNSKDNLIKNACPAVTSSDDTGENCNFKTANDLNFIHRTKLNAPDFIVWESHANLQSAFLRKKT